MYDLGVDVMLSGLERCHPRCGYIVRHGKVVGVMVGPESPYYVESPTMYIVAQLDEAVKRKLLTLSKLEYVSMSGEFLAVDCFMLNKPTR